MGPQYSKALPPAHHNCGPGYAHGCLWISDVCAGGFGDECAVSVEWAADEDLYGDLVGVLGDQRDVADAGAGGEGGDAGEEAEPDLPELPPQPGQGGCAARARPAGAAALHGAGRGKDGDRQAAERGAGECSVNCDGKSYKCGGCVRAALHVYQVRGDGEGVPVASVGD